MAVSLLPGLLLGPIAGVLADQYNRKIIIITTDLLRGISILLLAIGIYSFPNNHLFIISAFTLAGTINSCCRAFFQPAIDAFIPDLTRPSHLTRVMAYFNSSSQVALIVGQVLGGLLYRILGAPLLLLVDASSYFLSALSQNFITVDKSSSPTTHLSLAGHYRNFIQQLIQGYRFIRSHSGMWPTLLFSASINFFIAPVMLILPFYVTEHLHQQSHWYGILLAMMAMGSTIGYIIAAKWLIKAMYRAWLMLSVIAGYGCMLLMASLTHSPELAATTFLLGGIGLGLFNLNSMTLFQQYTPSNLRGRVMSLLMTASSFFLPAGLLFGGWLGNVLNNHPQQILLCSATGILLTTLIIMLNRSVRQFLSSTVVA